MARRTGTCTDSSADVTMAAKSCHCSDENDAVVSSMMVGPSQLRADSVLRWVDAERRIVGGA